MTPLHCQQRTLFLLKLVAVQSMQATENKQTGGQRFFRGVDELFDLRKDRVAFSILKRARPLILSGRCFNKWHGMGGRPAGM